MKKCVFRGVLNLPFFRAKSGQISNLCHFINICAKMKIETDLQTLDPKVFIPIVKTYLNLIWNFEFQIWGLQNIHYDDWNRASDWHHNVSRFCISFPITLGLTRGLGTWPPCTNSFPSPVEKWIKDKVDMHLCLIHAFPYESLELCMITDKCTSLGKSLSQTPVGNMFNLQGYSMISEFTTKLNPCWHLQCIVFL